MGKWYDDALTRAATNYDTAQARVYLLEEAIRRHRRKVWGKGKVDRPEDVILYAALDGEKEVQ